MSNIGQQTKDQYEKFLRDTSWYAHAHQHDACELSYLTLGLVGEAGEFAENVKKLVREAGFTNRENFAAEMKDDYETKLIDELGDVLWYFTRLIDFLGIDQDELMMRNTYKLFNRLVEMGHFPDLEWPFTDPFISYENVKEVIEGVHIDEEV